MKNEPVKFLSTHDAVLEKVILAIPKPTIESTNDVFHDLMSCVLEQQIHYRSTKKVFQKMLEKAALEILTPENFSQFEEKALTDVNLTISKYETVERIVAFFDANRINWKMLTNEEVIAKLASLKGIGTWTIDMILLYTLQRPNVFPYEDFHLKQIMVSLYGLDANAKLKTQMIDISNAWGEYKSLAVKYLLAWKAYHKKSSKN
jgi:DNA-3-methyladenine glycosylase II